MTKSAQIDPVEIEEVETYLNDFQTRLCKAIETIDGGKAFETESWQHAQGGGGRSKVIQNGHAIEKGGVNFSHVWGGQLPPAATAKRPELAGRCFRALGVSVVLHPENPYAPTAHANIRLFVAEKPGEPAIWWFGGGFDLTPYYGFEEDCVHFHQEAKKACDPFGEGVYSDYKAWADDYFYLKHRNEARGIGGIFFDDLNERRFSSCFAFIRSVGEHFISAYCPILERRKKTPFGEREKNFQRYRRGRYVEFNLIYDRGTLFGLQFGGRVESILMSLPPEVQWKYNWQPDPESEEAKLYTDFLPVRAWV